jgi:hypothetical protein
VSSSPLPRDVVAEAQDRLARAKEELEAAREQARGARAAADWLADSPDLLRLKTSSMISPLGERPSRSPNTSTNGCT